MALTFTTPPAGFVDLPSEPCLDEDWLFLTPTVVARELAGLGLILPAVEFPLSVMTLYCFEVFSRSFLCSALCAEAKLVSATPPLPETLSTLLLITLSEFDGKPPPSPPPKAESETML